MSLAFPERIGSCAMMPNASSAFRFRNFREALAFVQRVGELAESEGHHPDISFGWGRATVSLSTNKIKGLHENDFIMASKIDRMIDRPVQTPTGTPP
jgi:pterin-4a-carbinolamine dehydratase